MRKSFVWTYAFKMCIRDRTSPNTPKGEVIFGIGAGLLVVFIRYFGGYPEGVCYSILIMNICVWLIDKATLPKRLSLIHISSTGQASAHIRHLSI